MSTGKRERSFLLAGIATTVAVATLVMYAVTGRNSATTAKAPTVAVQTGAAPKTPWDEPDLQGIWSRDVDILERPAKYANQELFFGRRTR